MTGPIRSLLLMLCAVLGVGLACSSVTAQLRVVTYNTANGSFPGNDIFPRSGMDLVLEAIGSEETNGFAKPIDALILQEQADPATTTQAFVNLLNDIYGPGTYARSNVVSGPGFSSLHQSLIYNTNSVELIEEVAYGATGTTIAPRQTTRFTLRPVGYDSSSLLYVYNDHYKSDTGTTENDRRNYEAETVRFHPTYGSDALGEGAHVIYAGDFNIQSSSQPMYQTLLSSGNGQAFDPIDTPGSWNNNDSYRSIHTQNPHDGSAGLGVSGMDDRFDFQLVTGELLDDEGLSYIPGSYRAFGNNGTTYNQPINAPGNTSPLSEAQLDALAHVSDHLPVIADYQLPAVMHAELASVPSTIEQGAFLELDLLVENIADVLVPLGADELDYTVSATGALMGNFASSDLALGGGQLHPIRLDTSAPGAQNGTVTVATSSQGVPNPLFNFDVNFFVGPGTGPTFGLLAKDDFDSNQNLLSFAQSPAPGDFSSPADGFQIYQVGADSIPFPLVDDSNTTNPQDVLGVVDSATKNDAWFGVNDLTNPDNPTGTAAATWEFDIRGAFDLVVSIDMAAMGDFEAGADVFDWTYEIDGGGVQPLFSSSVDEDASYTYFMADGDPVTLDDPLFMENSGGEPVQLTNQFQTLSSSLTGTGNTLVIQLNALSNADEPYAFDNIVVEGFTFPEFLAADFNEDGVVDHLDLGQWKGDFGLNADSDADGDGDTDGDDFLAWQRQYGQTAGLGSEQRAVPEPSAGWLLIVSLLAGWGVFSRCRA